MFGLAFARSAEEADTSTVVDEISEVLIQVGSIVCLQTHCPQGVRTHTFLEAARSPSARDRRADAFVRSAKLGNGARCG